MSEEISVSPGRLRNKMNRLQQHVEAVVPDYNVAFDGQTELDTLREAEQNMQAMQTLLQSYKALLVKNVNQVHQITDQYTEADETVSNQIKGG